MKPGILVTRAIFPEVLARLRETFDVADNQADAVHPPEALAERLQGRVGLLANAADAINADLIAREFEPLEIPHADPRLRVQVFQMSR